MSAKALLRSIIPFGVRATLVRTAAYPRWRSERRRFTSTRADAARFPVLLSEHQTPLCRGEKHRGTRIQLGKERNIALAARLITGHLLQPGEEFSYHAAVGWPTVLRGFRKGLELQGGEMSEGVGGGCCSVSNLLLLIALRAGLDITERNRHNLDFFPDHGRTVPFGCGATVHFPRRDLRFRNPYDEPVLVQLLVEDGHLVGRILAAHPLETTIEVEERDHEFAKVDEGWERRNEIWRITRDAAGEILKEELVFKNQGRCLYDPENPD
jgi:vancomycin resistance protein VanW